VIVQALSLMTQPSLCLHRVKRVGFVMSAVCPVYPKQPTFPDAVGTSHLCQFRTLLARRLPDHRHRLFLVESEGLRPMKVGATRYPGVFSRYVEIVRGKDLASLH
jgi:hypothetical protein